MLSSASCDASRRAARLGTVKGEAQSPLANVEVTLEAGSPYEEAKGPNHRQVFVTGPSGHFEFTYISYDRRLPYHLSFAVSPRRSTQCSTHPEAFRA
jgi:hypothetical protein